jgi:hypothetical protein
VGDDDGDASSVVALAVRRWTPRKVVAIYEQVSRRAVEIT